MAKAKTPKARVHFVRPEMTTAYVLCPKGAFGGGLHYVSADRPVDSTEGTRNVTFDEDLVTCKSCLKYLAA